MTLHSDIRDKNIFPLEQPDDVPPTNTDGHHAPVTIDYYQVDELLDAKRPSGELSFYDPEANDRNLFDSIEQELIEVSSPPIYLYRLNAKTQSVDTLYGESKQRFYATPITVYGNYEDTAMEQVLAKYGIEEPQQIDLWFNYNYILRAAGDQIHVGDVLRTVDNKLWEVMISTVIHQELWKAIHNNVVCKRLVTEGVILPDIGNISVSPPTSPTLKETMAKEPSAGEAPNPIMSVDGFEEL